MKGGISGEPEYWPHVKLTIVDEEKDLPLHERRGEQKHSGNSFHESSPRNPSGITSIYMQKKTLKLISNI